MPPSQADAEAAMMMTMAAAELEHRVELLNKCGGGVAGRQTLVFGGGGASRSLASRVGLTTQGLGRSSGHVFMSGTKAGTNSQLRAPCGTDAPLRPAAATRAGWWRAATRPAPPSRELLGARKQGLASGAVRRHRRCGARRGPQSPDPLAQSPLDAKAPPMTPQTARPGPPPAVTRRAPSAWARAAALTAAPPNTGRSWP